MFDSTSIVKSPKIISTIKTKKELQSFYHYSKIVKLKEMTQKPKQQSINHTQSQNISVGARQSDHISNFEYFINQNSRRNQHRYIKESYQLNSQPALSQNSTEKLNWQKYIQNQKRVEQSINKFKFNHSLDYKQQSITRRRLLRLSSETSTQSKAELPSSRPVSKLGQHLQNEALVASVQKKQSMRDQSTFNHSQTDIQEFEESHYYVAGEKEQDFPPKDLQNQQEEESDEDLEEFDNEDESGNKDDNDQPEPYSPTKEQQQSMPSLKRKQVPKETAKKVREEKNDQKDKKNVVNKQATIKLNQTKKNLKASIKQQLNQQGNSQQQSNQQPLQSQQSECQQSKKNMNSYQKQSQDTKNEAYIKQLLNDQLKYKQVKQEEEEKQQERLEKIKQMESEIERKKNQKEEFKYTKQEDLNEQAFIKQQQLLKQQQLEEARREDEKRLKQQKEEEVEKIRQKQLDEAKLRVTEESSKLENNSPSIKSQQSLKYSQNQQQVPKIEKQKSVFFNLQSQMLSHKQSQEEIDQSNREMKKQIDDSIRKQKEEEERIELESLDFVDFMLRARDVYSVNYDKFILYSQSNLKKIKEPPQNIEEDDMNIYHHLKNWKHIIKKCSEKIFEKQVVEIQIKSI